MKTGQLIAEAVQKSCRLKRVDLYLDLPSKSQEKRVDPSKFSLPMSLREKAASHSPSSPKSLPPFGLEPRFLDRSR